MLAAFNAHYCRTGLDPQFDPMYPNPAPGGYASDCGTHVPPRVIAIMYAWNEAWYSDAYARRQCLEFLKLGLQGVTNSMASEGLCIYLPRVVPVGHVGRLHAGKSTVGFLNPVLYSAAAGKAGVLRDVQLGKNHGCGVGEAFPARRAWDAVTGLGTPDFEKLKELYLGLP
ncbi:hypothetical protein B0T13DRAFT_525239 [Neurospora crassa]|nr:hypothetical protein B0T13DRAFT_525239 [Neurospora crassa]